MSSYHRDNYPDTLNVRAWRRAQKQSRHKAWLDFLRGDHQDPQDQQQWWQERLHDDSPERPS